MADEKQLLLIEQHKQWMAALPEALRHHYTHVTPNEPIGLYRGSLVASIQGIDHPVDAVGTLALQWLPRPRIVYQTELEIDAVTWFGLIGTDVAINLPDGIAEKVPDQIVVGSQEAATTQEGTSISGHERMLSIGGTQEVTRVRFALANFMEQTGAFVREGGRAHAARLALSADEWAIHIDERPGLGELERQLKTSGGYAITHVGELKRTDGAAFLPEAAKPILQALHYFCSFAKGSFAGPMLPVGYDHNDEPIWAEWSCPTIDPWSPAMAWCDTVHPGQLLELFPLFMEKWRDPYWEDIIRIAVQYYRDANEPQPIQSAVAMAQIVLELLAYSILVENGKHLSSSAYKKNNADQNFVALLTHLGIPTDLPTELTTLGSTAKKEVWSTGPQAVAGLRNSVIHPKRNRRFDMPVWIDGWRLIVWYVELSLLSFFGYNGVYRNRLRRDRWVGMVEDVPWNTAKPSAPAP